MKAIILAGGKGTRLRPITLEIPKPLITVKRRPIINYLIEMFQHHGVTETKIVIRPEDREEFRWWKKRWGEMMSGMDISFAEEPEPMGTIGYWVHELKNWTGSEPFFYTNGDELKEIDLTEMKKIHETNEALATLALVEVERPEEYGVAVLEGSIITHFLEKPENPPSNLISGGLYLFDPKVIDHISEEKRNNPFLMAEQDLFPNLANIGKLTAYKAKGRWYDCGSLERWEKAINEWSRES
ncbi:MAG: hypothetical protein COU08_02810 [Candidatus Harrisonbacteria bacterium CG10_big_fil_rev_8_21_14_0_10_42_17]|uniref:Nucleotidyl transferase domain-containing protein n=1 Tax=Candidatus Harrisonbacteria bacterium CG10_big_fil_rev_8_21_14_0_10_42_17 TaxID=1974584 RepID=A0A2M6WHZ4_9BACT|nr:MAG: hypothetical protein COU08_02810 [Candidatus Harrisonbacteria bacterium CG10_big_fil_rev_8_21_14_0_10_42_17]